MSISSKAGQAKAPIIVVNNNFINDKALNFAKTTQNVYYIGGNSVLSDGIIDRISPYVSNGSSANRIFGANRHETNTKVINKFYPNSNLNNIIFTKSDNIGLIDTVSAGPFAAKIGAPILISNPNSIHIATNNFITVRRANNIYQIGGGFMSWVSNTIVAKLSGTYIESKITGKIIVLDPGHGGKDSGAVGINGVQEKDWNLVTALACADYLKNAGAEVVMTRSNDSFPTLQQRAEISNARATVLFCSIHYNSSDSSTPNGVEVYKGEGNLASMTANNVLNNILNEFDLNSRGVKDNQGYYVINNTIAPAILVEGGFVSNSKDVSILKSQEAQKLMGIQIAKGIIASFQ